MSDKTILSKNQSIAVIIISLIVLILIVYWPVQHYQFVYYDDQAYVFDNKLTRQGINCTSIRAVFTDIQTGIWHPLTMASHMLDWQLFGFKAGGHHWTNVIIHIINTVLLFMFLHLATGTIWRGAFVAALFAVHPINVESVAWVAQRKNVLSTFFWLATIIFYFWYTKKPNWKRYLFVVINFVLGLMSKPMLVTLPFVLLLLDYWPLERMMIIRRYESKGVEGSLIKNKKTFFLVLEKIPLFVLSAICVYFTLYAQKAVNAVASVEIFPIYARMANVIVSYALYIKKLFWPLDLAVFYPFNYHIPFSYVVLAAFLLAIITTLVCLFFRKFPYLPVGWFWYLGTMVPVIGIVQVGSQSMADRYAYVPFVGLFVAIVWSVGDILSKIKYHKIVTSIIFASLVMLLMILGYHQVASWKDTASLFKRAVIFNPKNYLAYDALGQDALRKHNYENALAYYMFVLKYYPENASAYNNVGFIFMRQGKIGEAVTYLQKALDINETSWRPHYNLGVLLMQKNDLEKAAYHFRRVAEIKPDHVDAYVKLGDVLMGRGKIEDAINSYENALRLYPSNSEALMGKQAALARKWKK